MLKLMSPRSTLHVLRSTLLLLLCACATTALAQPKIAVIDLRKVFDEYYKTKAADAQLKGDASELAKESKAYMEQYQKMTDEYKKLLDEANNQAVSSDEREKSKKAAESKLGQIKELETTVRQFEKTAATTLDERKRQMRDKILGEIRAVINAKVKAAGYTLDLNTASEDMNQTPMVIYHNGENDLTSEIITQLNAKAPIKPESDEPKLPEKKKTK